MMRPIPPLIIFLLSSPGLAFIKPGELSPTNLPELRSEATVIATAIADDGSIFLLGDFDEVDGIPRPGLAKLTNSGHLDPSFNPQLGVEIKLQVRADLFPSTTLIPNHVVPFASAYDNGNTTSFDPKPRPYLHPDTELFALNNGRLFVRKETAWSVLDATGAIDELAFPDFDRRSASALPQVLLNDRLIILTDDDRLVALDLNDSDSVDLSFTLDPSWTGTIRQAASAGNGKLWVLSQRDRFMVVCRLNSDGSMDLGFPPLELRDGTDYRIESGANGGFILINKDNGFIFAEPLDPFIAIPVAPCCGITFWRNEQRIQWFNSLGVRTGVINTEIGNSGRILLQATPWNRAVFFNNRTQAWQSQYTTGEPTELPEFPRATPNQSSDLPLVIETIDLFAGGLGNFSQNFLIGGTRLYTANGTLSPNRHVARLTRQAINLKAKTLPDGSLLVSGDFNQAGQWSSRGMIKITPEGEVDGSFGPGLDLRFIKEFEVSPAGKIFVLLKWPWTNPDGEQFNLLTLSAEGNIDSARTYSNSNSQVELLADGSLLIEPGIPIRSFPFGRQFLIVFQGHSLQRILPSGEIDVDWPLALPPNPVFYSSRKLLALRDGSFLWGNSHYGPNGTLLETITADTTLSPLIQNSDSSVIFQSRTLNFPPSYQLHRWNGGPDLDPGFVSRLNPNGNFIQGVQAGSRGKLLVWGQLNTPSGSRTITRLHPTGQIDYTFDPPPLQHHLLPETTPSVLTNAGLEPFSHARFSSQSIPSFFVQQDQSFLAGGSFGEHDGNFVHLADSHLAGYSDWITSATGELQSSTDDFDQDGRTNLHEYALGTDPIRPDGHTPEVQRTSISPLRFHLTCNPEAPEVRRTIDVSTDLSHWEIGTAHHFTTEPGPGCLNLRMTQSQHRLFLRTRYDLPNH